MFFTDRVKTGVSGFDELIEGGIPKGFNVLITGLPGTGKTIFGLQYLYTGLKNGENGLYVSIDSKPELLKEQAKQFGMDFGQFEKDKKVTFLDVPADRLKVNLFDMIEEEAKEIGAKRIVFDSLAIFNVNIDQFLIPLSYSAGIDPQVQSELSAVKGDKKYRYEVMPTFEQDPKGRTFYTGANEKRTVYLVINELSKLNTTNLIITDATRGGDQMTVDGVSEYVCDGVIAFYNDLIGARHARTISILKMRNTANDLYVHNFEFGRDGVIIKPAEVIY